MKRLCPQVEAKDVSAQPNVEEHSNRCSDEAVSVDSRLSLVLVSIAEPGHMKFGTARVLLSRRD